ncbi:site-specific integrase [Bradyrhizobium sp. F1.13.3]|uniref:tyrosine-type recombinase/integrase n=1 Tax=Bradyrhizobium sp. F1.13.3 TaxID=3156351 RepID=UPI003396A093
MDWKDVPAFVIELREKPDYSAKALMLTILCATRTNETLNEERNEFDLDNATWTIPKERMKAGVEHRVPLSDAAVHLLRTLPTIDGNPYVFPGVKRERPLSDMAMLEMLRGMREGFTVHGFRSSFQDWAEDTTMHLDVVTDMALAHTIKNKTKRAYRRGDAFDRRRDLMQQWCDYLFSATQSLSAKMGSPDCLITATHRQHLSPAVAPGFLLVDKRSADRTDRVCAPTHLWKALDASVQKRAELCSAGFQSLARAPQRGERCCA